MTELELLKRVDNDFTYHAPNQDQIERYAEIRKQARDFAGELIKMTPQSREQSLALTHLEEVVFFANAAIARNHDHQC